MTTTPHPEDMPEAIKAYEDRYQCSAEDPMCQADLGFFLAGWSASASLAEQRTRAMRDEIEQLRNLAATCYAGLGAECNLPEKWLDALASAAHGDPFSADDLLPFTLTPPSAPGKGEAEGKGQKQRKKLGAPRLAVCHQFLATLLADGYFADEDNAVLLDAMEVISSLIAKSVADDAAMASHPGPLERMQKIDDEMGEEP